MHDSSAVHLHQIAVHLRSPQHNRTRLSGLARTVFALENFHPVILLGALSQYEALFVAKHVMRVFIGS